MKRKNNTQVLFIYFFEIVKNSYCQIFHVIDQNIGNICSSIMKSEVHCYGNLLKIYLIIFLPKTIYQINKNLILPKFTYFSFFSHALHNPFFIVQFWKKADRWKLKAVCRRDVTDILRKCIPLSNVLLSVIRLPLVTYYKIWNDCGRNIVYLPFHICIYRL